MAEGYNGGACGEWCTYDLERARELYDRSPGIDGKITLWASDGSPEVEWLTAVGNSWSEAFGIEFEVQTRVWSSRPSYDFKPDGPFARRRAMDYPSGRSYLVPLYGPGAGEDNFGYVNDAANELFAEGDAAVSIDERLAAYAEAEALILQDMPSIPMWFGRTSGAYNENVGNVFVDGFGNLDFTRVTISG